MKTRVAVVVMVLLAIGVAVGLRRFSTVATAVVAPQDTAVSSALDSRPKLNWGEVMVSLRVDASDLVVTVTDASAQRRTVTLPGSGPHDFAPVIALVQSTGAKTCITDAAESVRYADIAFVADWVSGEPQVLEPEKIDGWAWYPLDVLPSPLFGTIPTALEALKSGRTFWDVSPS